MRILAVDDDPIILDLLTAVLGQAGYTDLVTARSGEQALSVLETVEQPFDCFLFDILMPGIDGVELCQRVRAMPSYAATPVLMVSRLDEKKHFDRAFSAGANDYVTKPFDATELKVRIRLAEQVSNQQKIIASQGLDRTKKVRLSEAFMLDDVPGAIDNLALDAYLERIPNGLTAMQFFAVKIGNISDLHRKATPDEYRLIINSVADAVTDVLSGSSYFITHSGNGVLSFIVHGHIDMTIEETSRMVRTEAGSLDFVLASGEHVIPEIIVGTSSATRKLTRTARIQALRESIMDAEDVATMVKRLGPQMAQNTDERPGFLDRLMAGF